MKFILTCLLTTFILTNNFASIIIVTNTNDSGTGSLRNAIDLALNNDTIQFSKSLISNGNNTIVLATEITLNKILVIKGVYNSSDTLYISGNNNSRIFNIVASPLIIIDSVAFINGHTSLDGGAILTDRNTDSLLIKNCSFVNNKSDRNGGAICTNAHTFIYNTIVSNNESSNDGGGIFSDYKSLSVRKSLIENNKSIENGGGIKATIFVKLDSSIINNNSCESGGGIYSLFYNFEISDSEIKFNNAVNGGGVYVDQLIINNSSINNNSALSKGGGIYNDSNSQRTLTITNSSINENTSGSYGGGIRSAYKEIKLKESTINGNYSSASGGAIYINYVNHYATKLFIENSTVNNNESRFEGGGLYTHSFCSFFITNSTFSKNIAGSKGGAIYLFIPYTLNFTPTLNITHSTFNNNSSSSSGAAIYYSTSFTNSQSFILHSTFTNNISEQGLSALSILSNKSNFKLINSSLYKNSSIQIGADSTIVGNCIIAENGNDSTLFMNFYSLGYNIFSDQKLFGSNSTDVLGAIPSRINLDTLRNNGGLTNTLLPIEPSIAINSGNINDISDAQNRAIYGIRDVGAAESLSDFKQGANVKKAKLINIAKLFPNPSNTIIKLEFINQEEKKIKVINSSGIIVFESDFFNLDHYELNCQTWKQGIYFIEINSINNYYPLKLVVNK